MRPLPEQMRHVVYAFFLQSGKQAHLAATGLKFHDRQRFGGFRFIQLVRFGQNDQKLQTFLNTWANHFKQNFVQLGDAMAWVAHQHDGFEVFAGHQIVRHHTLPAQLVGFGYRCVAVAG